MVQSCCVKNCHNRQDRESDRRFFSVPIVCTGKGAEMFELTSPRSRRRRERLAQLRLKGFSFEATARRFVCSDHFFKKCPAYIRDTSDPDWKPTLKLGHEDGELTNVPRYNRLKKRKLPASVMVLSTSLTDTVGDTAENWDSTQGGESTPFNDLQAAPPPDVDGGVYCQTEGDYAWISVDEERNMRAELNRLTQENRQLKAELASREMTLESLRENEDTVRYFTELASREMTLESLRENEDTVRYFTGLPTYMTLATLFAYLSSHLPYHNRCALSPFQALMLTLNSLMHIRLNAPLQHLAYIFSISRSTASKVFHETIHTMYCRLKSAVFWPDRKSIRTSLPPQFLSYPWNRTVSIIDCFELFIEKSSAADSATVTWSNYKHNNTAKYLISITPQGHISFLSKGWGGRASDKHITAQSGYLDNLQRNDLILADRGFDIQEMVALRCAEVKIPAFTKGKSQMTAYDIESTRRLAHLRIHVERNNRCAL